MISILPENIIDKILVVYDPVHLQIYQIQDKKYLVYPCSFSPDEPVEEILEAINNLKKIKVCVTGNYQRKPSILKYKSNYVCFTGFLPRNHYENLIKNSSAIITGTKRSCTFLMSGWEAITYSKPLIISYTECLHSFFKNYATFYDYTNESSIEKAISNTLGKSISKIEQNILLRKVENSVLNLNKILDEIELK